MQNNMKNRQLSQEHKDRGEAFNIVRCRLITSWSGSTFQGLGCSPIKVVRELGSKRCETVWSISGVGAGILKGAKDSTRGFLWMNH
jgi:hypothetical protein